MNPSEDARQNVYESILKTASKRLEQAIPGSYRGRLRSVVFSCGVEFAVSAQRRLGLDRRFRNDTASHSSTCRGRIVLG